MALVYRFIVVGLFGAIVGSGVTLVMVHHSALPAPATTENTSVAIQPKTYTYYKAHHDEAVRRWSECSDKGISPMADTAESRDCNSAFQAR